MPQASTYVEMPMPRSLPWAAAARRRAGKPSQSASRSAVRNVAGSFYDFRADRFRGTGGEVLADPPDDWGGRAIVGWVGMGLRHRAMSGALATVIAGCAVTAVRGYG